MFFLSAHAAVGVDRTPVKFTIQRVVDSRMYLAR